MGSMVTDRTILLCVIAAWCVYLLFQSHSMTWKRATRNGNSYYVKNLRDAHLAANHLAHLHELVDTLLKKAKELDPNDTRLDRIKERWTGTLAETPNNADNVAYSLGKNTIHICVREKDGRLADINTSMFVLIHELAHIATDTYGHSKQFWTNMKYLLEMADAVGVYKYVDHDEDMALLCGRVLGTNPLSCVKDKTCESERKKSP